jgi:hypothetical protein
MNMNVLKIGDNCKICNEILNEKPQKEHILPLAFNRYAIKSDNSKKPLRVLTNNNFFGALGSSIPVCQLWCHTCEKKFDIDNDFYNFVKNIDLTKCNMVDKFIASVLLRFHLYGRIDLGKAYEDIKAFVMNGGKNEWIVSFLCIDPDLYNIPNSFSFPIKFKILSSVFYDIILPKQLVLTAYVGKKDKSSLQNDRKNDEICVRSTGHKSGVINAFYNNKDKIEKYLLN